ncbi:MAG: MFS transporter [Xenococcaceae cyanobacterium]
MRQSSSTGLKYWSPLLAASMAMFIVVVDSTMMNVAVPTIIKDLSTNVSAVQSVIALYSLVMAALMITGGKLGSIFGIRLAFSVGLICYGVGTLIAAISWDISSLAFGWSLLEGIGAALLVPAAFTVVTANYSGKNRAQAFGILAGVQASAAAVGPILGGILTTYFTWRWGFGGEAVIAVAILPLIPMIRQQQTRDSINVLDWGGVILSSFGMLVLVLGFLVAGRYGWWSARRPFVLFGQTLNPFGLSPTPLLIVVGLILMVCFFHWQERREAQGQIPLVRPRIFTNSQFVTGASMYATRSIFVTGFLFVMPLYMQSALGFSAFESGLALLPFSAAVFIVSMNTASWGDRITPKTLIQIGLLLLALGSLCAYAVTSTKMTIGTFFMPVTVMGIGMGLLMAQLVNLTLSSVDPEDTSEASGVNNAVGELGNSLGTAVIGSLLLMFFFTGVVDQMALRADLDLSYQERNQLIVQIEDAPDIDTKAGQKAFTADLPEKVKEDLQLITDDSSVRAMQNTLLVILLMVILTLLLSTFLPNQRIKKAVKQRLRQAQGASVQHP